MGQRGELFTRRVFVGEGEKTYFFNVKENRYGDLFLNLAESRKKSEGGFQRHSLMIYLEDLTHFKDFFYKSLELLKDDGGSNKLLEFKTPSGRRSYHYSIHYSRQGAYVLITEKRLSQDLDFQHETIRLDLPHVEDFLTAFRGAARFMENSKRKHVIKLSKGSSKK